jgi:hypothetical protein
LKIEEHFCNNVLSRAAVHFEMVNEVENEKTLSQYILPRLVDHFDFLKSEEQGINSHLVPGYVALSKMGSRVQGTTLGRILIDTRC